MRIGLIAVASLLPAVITAQTNLGFGSGLTGWSLPPAASSAGYSAEGRSEGCRSAACAVLLAGSDPEAGGMGNLQQAFDAKPYRGKAIVLQAWMRIEGSDPAARGQLWLRVERANGKLGFFDTMGDRPVRSRQWQLAEIEGEVAADAKTITLGILSRGKGRVWIDSPALDSASLAAGPRAALESLYRSVDAAYSAGDVDAIASFALPEARLILAGQSMPLMDALTPIMDEIRKGTRFHSESTVTSVRVSGTTATVYVNNIATRTHDSKSASVASTDRDTWVRTASGWRLKESSLVDTHPLEGAR